MSFRIIARSLCSNPGNKGRKWRKLRDALRWQVHKRVRRTPRRLRLASGARFRAYPDCVVSSALIYAQWPEYHELQFLRRHLQPGQIVLDVGANVGHVSLLLSDVVGPQNLVAFEPTPITFERLSENWRLNNWATDNLFAVALGDEKGTVLIANSGTPDTTNQVQVLGGDQSQATENTQGKVQIPLARLDDYEHLWQGKTVGLLKVDVEGYEAPVLRGGERLLGQARPHLIMFESLAGSLDASIAALLHSASYDVFELDGAGQPDFSRQSAQNLFAVPRERRAALETASEAEGVKAHEAASR